MRMSILNTATTEQMGYGMVSFFVCFLLMNRNPFQNFTLVFYKLVVIVIRNIHVRLPKHRFSDHSYNMGSHAYYMYGK